MTLLFWIIIGLAAGTLAGLLQPDYGTVESTIVAIVGAVIGGWIYATLSGSGMTEFSIASAVTSLIAAVAFVGVARMVTRGRSAI